MGDDFMRGIFKLRIVLMLVLTIELIALMVSFLGGSISDREATDFVKGLTYSEQNQIATIYSNYPDYGSDTIFSISGWLLYLSVAMTAFLLYKIWSKQKID